MSTGGGDLGDLGSAHVRIQADMSALDAALEGMPNRIRNKASGAISSLEREFRRVQEVLRSAIAGGESQAEIQALQQQLVVLRDRMAAVVIAAQREAEAHRQNAAAMQFEAEQARILAALDDAAAWEKRAAKYRGAAEAGQGFGRAARQAGEEGYSAGLRMLFLGQAVDDLQYGLRAVINNVPQLVFAFGGTAGMAGTIGIVAVAINQLVSHWDQLKAAFGDDSAQIKAMRSLEGVRTKLEEVRAAIRNRPETLGVAEFLSLSTEEQRLRRQQSMVERLGSARPAAEQEQADAVVKAIGEHGGLEQISRNLIGKGVVNPETLLTPENAQALKELREQLAKPLAERKFSAAAGRLPTDEDLSRHIEAILETGKNVNAQAGIQGFIAEAATNPAKLKALAELVDKAGMSDLGTALRAATPEARQEEQTRKSREQADKSAAERAEAEDRRTASERDTQAARIAQSILGGPLGRELRAGGGTIGGAGGLIQSGLDNMRLGEELRAAVEDKLREAVKGLILSTQEKFGVDRDRAKEIIRAEARLEDARDRERRVRHEMPQERMQATFEGIDQYLRSVQESAFEGKADTQKQLLEEAKKQTETAQKAVDALTEIRDGRMVAVAG